MKMNQLNALMLLTLLVTNIQAASAQEDVLKIGLIGDSTVATSSGWGPAFAKRFNDKTQVLNYAKNGATLESISHKLDELLKLKPDYVLIQFGHNDQKRYGTDAYRTKLTSYVQRVTEAGGQAIVLSSVTRRNFDEHGKIQLRESGLKGNLTDFEKAAQAVAEEQDVKFINLHAISIAHHNKIGPEATAEYNFSETDTTHFSPKGAEATTDLILKELKTVAPEITANLK
ncbi:rhamnogalacturonan acetylesterase [Rubinisphaera italica]|uniref:Rhamnogalacturonan acetylesterase RhgT n=1 Tax=Rubinisphaera italica TaxID=2527969 RepID=A0A5C5XG92_9PLAN|nr:rhamnogalacturonan acetylesterase [Rubinisphaera italica]TWT61768.1 Rhamnogalacturonan acetylesterase RhgT [Rubinisphaera italica]